MLTVGSLFSEVAVTKRTCSRCGGRKDFYAIVCRACKRSDEWATPLRGKRGPDHPAWKGGYRTTDKDGYLVVYAPDHPWPRVNGMVREHVRVMELHIGRRLRPAECVHHRDGNIANNVLENLELLTKAEHSSLHRRADTHLRERDELGRFAVRDLNA